MFRSRRREVVYPQAEHARMSGAVAAVWRPDDVPLPFASFVRGVTLHDRGYGELDADGLGEIDRERWLEIQARGFRARSGDPVVDLVVALHIGRLMGDEPSEIDDVLSELLAATGTTRDAALAADAITSLCDMIAFAFCFEKPLAGTAGGVSYDFDGGEQITLDPWPLAVPWLGGVVRGFLADGYPDRLEPVVSLYRVTPR